MAMSSADRNPFDRLAENFVIRLRGGEEPSLTEYTEQYPLEIRRLAKSRYS